jgi:hypothetical protein
MSNNVNLKRLNGIELLALRVTRPELETAINAELDSRSGIAIAA